MCSSNPLAFTSRFSVVAAELLISRHAPCHKHLFLVQNFCTGRIPRDYREDDHNSCDSEKAGIPANSYSRVVCNIGGNFGYLVKFIEFEDALPACERRSKKRQLLVLTDHDDDDNVYADDDDAKVSLTLSENSSVLHP